MLVARLSSRAGADVAHIDPKRLLRDAFEPGDLWFVTGDFFQVDTEGDFWFVDRAGQMIHTRLGAVASTRIEDAIYEASCVALCIAAGRNDPDATGIELPIAAVQLQPGSPSISPRCPRRSRRCPSTRARTGCGSSTCCDDRRLPPDQALDPRPRSLGWPDVLAWDARAQRYAPTALGQVAGGLRAR